MEKNTNHHYGYGGVDALYDNNDNVYGVIQYYITYYEYKSYLENYKKDSSNYLYNLQKHCIAASTVVAKKDGKEFPQTYVNDEIFYLNEQLKYNGANLYEYSKKAGKNKKISLISSGTTSLTMSYLPNPVWFGGKVYKYSKPETFKYMFYDVDMKDDSIGMATTTFIYIDPSFLENQEEIELTSEEKSKLKNAQEQYNKYIEKANKINSEGGSLFEEEPQYSELPLSAGKYKKDVLEAVTDFLNVARAGLGIGTLELDETIAEQAQHKAVLVYYMNSLKDGNTYDHYFPKPDGVDQEFYDKAMSTMNENLYHGDAQTSIVEALNDGYGDPTNCGHRYNLLNPTYTKWGVGSAGKGISWGIQGAHKFSGYRTNTSELVAWPSNGIMPIDMINGSIGNWTAKFYGYEATEDTSVTVKCLNTNKSFEINNTNANNSNKLLKTNGSIITFRDDNITYEDGTIFEITIHNLKNSETGKIQEYTYRSVFKKFYVSKIKEVTSISLDKTKINILEGKTAKLNAKIVPEDADIKIMKFTSDDENIATVRQDGMITAVSAGTTVIKAYAQNGVYATCEVSVKEKTKLNINKNYDKSDNTVTVTVTSNNEFAETKPTWTLSADKKSYSKTYSENGNYSTNFIDIYGTEEKLSFEVNEIDENAPQITISQKVNEDNTVTVTATANRKLKNTKPTWKLSDDMMSYTKTYNENGKYSTNFVDLAGRETKISFEVTGIKSGLTLSKKLNSDNTVTVTVKSTTKLKNTKPTWKLSDDMMSYTKTYPENGSYSTNFIDINNNEKVLSFEITEIDDKGPKITISKKLNADNTVTVTATADEKMQNTKPTWNLSKNQMVYTKIYPANGRYSTKFVDLYGNISLVFFDVTEIESGFTISKVLNADNTVTVTVKSKSKLKDTKPTWKLSEDQMSYSKTYPANGTYTTKFVDMNETEKMLSFSITEIESGFTVSKVLNKDNTVTVTVKSKSKLKDTKPTWKLSEDQMSYSKTYSANGTYTTKFIDVNETEEFITFAINELK